MRHFAKIVTTEGVEFLSDKEPYFMLIEDGKPLTTFSREQLTQVIYAAYIQTQEKSV